MKYLPVLKHIVLLAKNKNAGVMRYAFIQTYVKGFVDALKITDPKYPGIPELERVTKLENDFSSDCFFQKLLFHRSARQTFKSTSKNA